MVRHTGLSKEEKKALFDLVEKELGNLKKVETAYGRYMNKVELKGAVAELRCSLCRRAGMKGMAAINTICYNCGKPFHYKVDCWEPMSVNCWRCGKRCKDNDGNQVGHYARDCDEIWDADGRILKYVLDLVMGREEDYYGLLECE